MSVILVCAQHAVLWLREISLQFLFYPICFKLLFDHLSLAAHPEEQKVKSRLVCFSLSPHLPCEMWHLQFEFTSLHSRGIPEND